MHIMIKPLKLLGSFSPLHQRQEDSLRSDHVYKKHEQKDGVSWDNIGVAIAPKGADGTVLINRTAMLFLICNNNEDYSSLRVYWI